MRTSIRSYVKSAFVSTLCASDVFFSFTRRMQPDGFGKIIDIVRKILTAQRYRFIYFFPNAKNKNNILLFRSIKSDLYRTVLDKCIVQSNGWHTLSVLSI